MWISDTRIESNCRSRRRRFLRTTHSANEKVSVVSQSVSQHITTCCRVLPGGFKPSRCGAKSTVGLECQLLSRVPTHSSCRSSSNLPPTTRTGTWTLVALHGSHPSTCLRVHCSVRSSVRSSAPSGLPTRASIYQAKLVCSLHRLLSLLLQTTRRQLQVSGPWTQRSRCRYGRQELARHLPRHRFGRRYLSRGYVSCFSCQHSPTCRCFMRHVAVAPTASMNTNWHDVERRPTGAGFAVELRHQWALLAAIVYRVRTCQALSPVDMLISHRSHPGNGVRLTSAQLLDNDMGPPFHRLHVLR